MYRCKSTYSACFMVDLQCVIFIISHLKSVRTYVFDWFGAAAAWLGSKMCTDRDLCTTPSPLNFQEIPMIFCTHVSCAVPECSAKFGSKCSRFCEMTAILHKKNHTFALSSQSVFLTPTELGRDIARGKGHLVCGFWPRTTLTSENGGHFYGLK